MNIQPGAPSTYVQPTYTKPGAYTAQNALAEPTHLWPGNSFIAKAEDPALGGSGFGIESVFMEFMQLMFSSLLGNKAPVPSSVPAAQEAPPAKQQPAFASASPTGTAQSTPTASTPAAGEGAYTKPLSDMLNVITSYLNKGTPSAGSTNIPQASQAPGETGNRMVAPTGVENSGTTTPAAVPGATGMGSSLTNVQPQNGLTAPAATLPPVGAGGVGRGQDLQAQGGGNVIEVAPGEDLQAAIEKAPDGSVIKLGAGVYNVSDLNVYKSITLDGTDGTVFDGQNQAKLAIKAMNAPNITLQDISIRNYTDQGIYANSTDGLTVQNIDMQKIGDNGEAKSANNNDAGIQADNVTNSVFRNLSMDDIKKKGIGLGLGKNNLVENVAITNVNKEGHYDVNNDVAGIKTMLETGTTIRNNQLGTVNGNSLWVDSGGAGNKVEGNQFTDNSNKRGVYIEKTPNTTVTNNGGAGLKHEVTKDGKGNTKLSGNQGTYDENGTIYKVGNELQNVG